jgi:hypothetical protein
VGVVLLLNAFSWTLPWLDALFVVTLTLTVISALHYLYSSSTRKARS